MFERVIQLPGVDEETFFLWGPRQTGKTTLLRARYPDSLWIDLLKAEEYRRYIEHPEWLRQEIDKLGVSPHVVIDEVQKVPHLLDEVHWLIENRGMRFALCGSSARKVRRGHANLLGGRAIRRELFGLTSAELGEDFELDRLLNHGALPRHYLSDRPHRLLDAYVSGYLKEEVAAEGLVRRLPTFSAFLEVAALSDTELVNFSSIARECGVSNQTIRAYFQILEDTLLATWLPAYQKRPKRRVIRSPKFYFNDLGVVNFLARRGELRQGSELYGKAFESWCLHELRAYNAYTEAYAELSYWRLASGIEVDFIINHMQVAIEAKSARKIQSDHLKGLRHLREDHPELGRCVLLCLEDKARKTPDGIEILPAADFARRLWDGEIF
ncbi:MAG: ATP-binding protein [Deltaproteobacteria bacterium]|nr:ATP-binding protein [Deltaproteobacteria bacterium]